MKRIQSIDFLRGVVMVLMAIDHSRTFLHRSFYEFNAENLKRTTPVLFFTRWITHFCAPVFIFLVGVSAYLMLKKTNDKKGVSIFLITRALLLIVLELTLFRVCWQGGDFFQPFISLLVIWAIGVSMLFLALLIWLPYRVILCLGLLILLLHNTLENVQFPEGSGMETLWAFFYRGGYGSIGKLGINFLYPVLPYFGIVALGYCLGALYSPEFSVRKRRKVLLSLGITAILVFVILRYFNLYGDPRPWVAGKNSMYSIMAFLRTTKYPVSLLYAFMTLGPALIILALIEPARNRITAFFVTIGSVPFFYYILHLILFALIANIRGFNEDSLAMEYGWFVIVVTILYLLCRMYARYKFARPNEKWLKYF
jgi:uncharacterized membrane protein